MIRAFIMCSLLLLFSPAMVMAQDSGTDPESTQDAYTFEFRDVELAEVLDQVAKEVRLDLVYDPRLVRDIFIRQRIRNLRMPDLLQQILDGTGLDYITLSTGTIVIVENVHDSPVFGSFAGKVTDKHTGEPLPGATIMLADASGGTTTNHAGLFSLNRMISGTYTIVFSYVGYEPVYKTIEIKPNQNQREQVSLEPKPVDIAPIVVESHRPMMPVHHRTEINPDNTWNTNGEMNDVIRNLNIMPGIQYGLPMSDLHLQGSDRGDHRMKLDGVPIYNPYSVGQIYSAFSPYAIGNIHLHKAGYGVEQGSQIAGLINLQHDLKGSGGQNALLQADQMNINLRGDASLGEMRNGDSRLNLMAAARTNYWDIYQEPTLVRSLKEWDVLDPLITNMANNLDVDATRYTPADHLSDIHYFDIHAAASYELDTFNTLNASFYLAENQIETRLLSENRESADSPPYLLSMDQHKWNNVMGQVNWSGMVTSRFDLSARASYSANRFDNRKRVSTQSHSSLRQYLSISAGSFEFYEIGQSQALPLPTRINGNQIEHFILGTDGTFSISRFFRLKGGLQLERVYSELDLEDLDELSAGSDQNSTLLSTYLKSSATFGRHWNAEAGTRLTWFNSSHNSRMYTEPRISLQYDRQDSGIGYWSARISTGIYRQFINQHEITNFGPSAVVPTSVIWSHAGLTDVPKAYHLTGSLLFEPSANSSIHLEGYYKWQPSALITTYQNTVSGFAETRNDITAVAETSSMESLGGSVRINRSLLDNRFKFMAGYDYNFNRTDYNSQFGKKIAAPWNEPHRLQFRSLVRILPGFSAVAKWQGIWGRAWAFRHSYYNFLLFGEHGERFVSPENDRLSPFYQLDLSFIYKQSVHFSELELRLDLINVLNRRNELDHLLLPSGQDQENFEIHKRRMPGFNPSISVQLHF